MSMSTPVLKGSLVWLVVAFLVYGCSSDNRQPQFNPYATQDGSVGASGNDGAVSNAGSGGLGGNGGEPAAGTGGESGAAAAGAGGEGGAGNGAGEGGAGVGGDGGTAGTAGDGGIAGSDGGTAMDGGTPDSGGGTDAGNNQPPDSNCDRGEHGGHVYWFCTNNEDWDAARELCQAVGGDLAVINDESEQTFVADTAGSGEWLIGLNKKNASGATAVDTWEWVDGTEVSAGYENWDSGEPDSLDCGVMNDGAWRDISCGNGEDWICEVL